MNGESGRLRREVLLRAARGRAAELGRQLALRQGEPAAPGDLFVLAETAGLPVEWAVLDRRPGGELLAVPADSHPLAGSADVTAEPGGSPVLRCRFGLWLDPDRFDPKRRSGVLPEEVAAVALQRWREVEAGEVRGSPLAEEADADPEYGDWIRGVVERARGLAATSHSSGTRIPVPAPPAFRSWSPAPALAAVFAFLALGLSLWVVQLRREVGQLSKPLVDLPKVEIEFGTTLRGEKRLEMAPGKSRVVLELAFDPSLHLQHGYLELIRGSGKVVYRSELLDLRSGELTLEVSRRDLPNGFYRLLLYSEAGFDAPVLEEKGLWVQTRKDRHEEAFGPK